MSTVAPEQTGFELDRFQWSGEDRLVVEGRWFGVRGRRFVRPVLTVRVAGARRRLLALLEHKPWAADEGTAWIAAFPWDGPRDDVGDAELEVGALTVDLPPPGGAEQPGTRHKVEKSIPVRDLSREEVRPEIAELDLFILGGGGILYDEAAAEAWNVGVKADHCVSFFR